MSVNCVPACDDYVVHRLLDKFEIQVESDPSRLFGQVESFLHDYLLYYERFIFIYLPVDLQIILPFFQEDPTDEDEEQKRSYLFPLLFSSFKQHLIDTSSFQSPPFLYNFIENQDRIVQLIGLTFDQFLHHVPPHVLDDIPTCIVLLNIDQVCYDSSQFIKLNTTFLSKLSRWCAYLGVTQHKINASFYQYFARSLGKKIVMKTEISIKAPNYDNWTFTSLLKVLSKWIGDPSIPATLHSAMINVRNSLPNLLAFISDSSFEERQKTIQRVKKEIFGEKNWKKYRQFAYALFLADKYTKYPKMKFLIITNSFTQKSWKQLQKDMGFPEYDSIFTPQFRSLTQLEAMPLNVINQFDHLVLDLGDEITEWLSGPPLITIIDKLKSLKYQLPSSLPTTFFHPQSVTSDVMKWLLINPPVPLGIIQNNASDYDSELIYQTILLTAHKRLTKREFYRNIRASWLQIQHDLDSDKSLSNEVKELRAMGLLDRVHYQTTTLGHFFLNRQFSITSFCEFLKVKTSQLFKQALSKQMTPILFLQFFYTCAAWYFYERPEDDFNDLEWIAFRRILYKIGNVNTLPQEIEDNVNDMICELRRLKTEKKLFKVDKYSRYPLEQLLWEKIKYQTKEPSKALVWALHDILNWMKLFKRENTPIPSSPYFLVRSHARITAEHKDCVSEASYVRAITRVFDENYSPSHKYFTHQPGIPRYEQPVSRVVRRLRRLLKLHYLQLTNNRGSQVLIFRSIAIRNWKSNMNFPWSFEYLYHTCKECLYFNAKRKRHCTFLSLFKGDQTLSEPCANRTDIHRSPVFSSMTGCPIWRPKKPVVKESSKIFPKYCYHCYQKLTRRKGQQQIECQCGTEYQFHRNNITQEYQGFTYQLTSHHEKFQETKLLFPEDDVKIILKEELHELPAESHFPSMNYEEFLQLLTSPHCLPIKASDKIGYSQDLDKLEIKNKMGIVRYIGATEIMLIDTPHINEELLEFKHKHPQILINYRTERLTLSRREIVHIKQSNNLIPTLQVTRKQTQGGKNEKSHFYSLNQIYSVFNVGKPRLNQTLKQYGVTTIYTSTRGITNDPIEIIEETLTLDGVRQTLSEIHLLGLVVSVLRASAQLIGFAYTIDQPSLGDQIATQIKGLLMRSPNRLYQHYQPFHGENYPTVRQQCRLEAWIFKPFAEGLRELIVSLSSQKSGGLLDNIRQQLRPREGRTVTRRIEKKHKIERDFYGGYSPLDATLNTIHRSMRYQFRLKNARIGFGFNTRPIFSHQTHDKPGRSGHLDLEEVARILSRFVVLEGIYNNKLGKSDFEVCLDDNNFPYYVPYYQALTKIRSTFVYKKLFATPIHYDNRWYPLQEAHRIHVRHLRTCLEECYQKNSEHARQTYLLKTYRPLIFHIKPLNRQVIEIQKEFFYLLNYNWVNRTQKLWKRLGIDHHFTNHFLFNSELVERISSL